MNKILKIFLLIGIMTISLSFAMACNDTDSTATEEITVNFIEEGFIPDVYMNEEFDIMETIDEINEDYSYELTECFYLDDHLSRMDIPFEGTSFTPTTAFDVYFTLKVSDKHGQSKEFEMQLPITIPMDEVQQRWVNGWADTGVSKKMTAMPEHLVDGKKSAVKVTYSGTWNPPTYNGVNIGSFAPKNVHTTWENAVIYLKVKNISPFGLTFGVSWGQNKDPYYIPKNGITELTYSTCPQFQLAVGEWTEVAFSLRKLGINYNLFDDSASFGFKVRITDATDLQPPYSWGLVIAESEVVDYDSERFPDLDTTMPNNLPMDEIQEAWMRSWADDGVGHEMSNDPDHLIDGKNTAVKITYSGDWNPPTYNGVTIGGFKQAGINTTWENAVIYLKVKNISTIGLTFGLNWAQDRDPAYEYTPINGTTALTYSTCPKFQLAVGEWTEVAFSLRKLGINYNLFDDGASFGFKVRITDATDLQPPYSWGLVIAESGVVDYDSERFPDLDTSLSMDEIQEAWINSWVDDGVCHEMSNDPDHLIDGKSTAVKITYSGDWNPPTYNGVTIGGFKQAGINTTWENAVVYLKVKNISTIGLTLGMSWGQDKAPTYEYTPINGTTALTYSTCPQFHLAAGEWVEAAISLKHLGITYNLFEDGARFGFKVRITDATDLQPPYSWGLVIAESGVVDYDSERFPDLDTSLSMDAIQEAWINSWVDDGVGHEMSNDPDHLIDGKNAAVKITYSGDWNPPTYNGVTIGGFKQAGINTTWENAVVYLKVKNISTIGLTLGMSWGQDKDPTYEYTPINGTTALTYSTCPQFHLAVGEWVEVAISLKHLGITYNLFDDGASFGFKVRITDAADLQSPYSWGLVIAESGVVDYDSERFSDLNTSLPPNEMEQAWLNCWHSDGVDAQLTENPEHLIDGISSAVRFVYDGKWNGWNPPDAGLAIGEFGQNGINTTWENAVIYLKVKSLSVQPIRIGMNITEGTKTKAMYFSELPKTIVPVDTVSEVVISLKHLGITYNLFDDGAKFYFIINLPDLPNIPDPTDVKYTWDMVVLDSAVIDYDSERFPDLDTSLPPNEMEQAWLNCWHSDGVAAEYTENPDHLIDGVSSAVRFVYDGKWNGWNPSYAGLSIGQFGQNGINTTWENAVIYLKVKNLSVQPIQIGMNIAEGTKTKAMYFSELPKTIVPVDTVSEVVISLKHLGITYNLFDDGAVFSFAVNLPDLPDIPDPTDVKYIWDMVVLDSAVIDYDSERFPDLDTSLPMDEIQEAWINSWVDDGVGHEMSNDPDHLIDGKNAAVKITYSGDWNPPTYNGVTIGGFKQAGINTTWEDAVIYLKVKNISTIGLTLGMSWGQDKDPTYEYTPIDGTTALTYSTCPQFHLAVGEWVEVAISLKHLGITYNLFEDGARFGFKVRITDATDLQPPYNWGLVIAESEIVDYDSERFPDLDTSLPPNEME